MAEVELRSVAKTFGDVSVLRDVDLKVADGEFCVFVGPSGCGKSTLLRMVAGLEDVSAGDVLIGGQRVNDTPPARRGVAMVFQSYALFPHLSVRENLSFGLTLARRPKEEIERKVQSAAKVLQLEALLDRKPKALSGGQRQRVAIGRAIVREPEVFLFDEPLSNLDAALRVQTRFEIAKLHHDFGRASMIYVTHDQVEAMTLADKIVLLRAGKGVQDEGSVAQYGTPMELYHRPQNLFVAEFIGSPKMNVMPGKLVRAEPDHAIVEVHGEQIKVCVDARAASAGSAVTIGIRPEHLLAGEDGEGSKLHVNLFQMERLGDSSLLYLTIAPEAPLVTLRLEGHAPQSSGDRITLRLRPEQCHLFDSKGQAFKRTVVTPA